MFIAIHIYQTVFYQNIYVANLVKFKMVYIEINLDKCIIIKFDVNKDRPIGSGFFCDLDSVEKLLITSGSNIFAPNFEAAEGVTERMCFTFDVSYLDACSILSCITWDIDDFSRAIVYSQTNNNYRTNLLNIQHKP